MVWSRWSFDCVGGAVHCGGLLASHVQGKPPSQTCHQLAHPRPDARAKMQFLMQRGSYYPCSLRRTYSKVPGGRRVVWSWWSFDCVGGAVHCGGLLASHVQGKPPSQTGRARAHPRPDARAKMQFLMQRGSYYPCSLRRTYSKVPGGRRVVWSWGSFDCVVGLWIAGGY